MPNVKKPDSEKTSDFRRTITLTPPVVKRVEKLAEKDNRPIANMLRVIVEKGLPIVEAEFAAK